MRVVSMLAAVVLALMTAVTAIAQVTPPGEDHYLVYKVLNPPSFSVPIMLSDQFILNGVYQTYTLDYFMTPVNKNNEGGIIDDVTHYTWWKISTYPFGAYCIIINQFTGTAGEQVNVYQPQYLLNPAIKTLPPNPPYTGPPPVKNHYVAYDAVGAPPPPPIALVNLLDQFGQFQAVVGPVIYLAPPATKTYHGTIEPILDPVNHLVFYGITMPAGFPPPPPVVATDEFGVWPLALGDRVYLGVPSYKSGVVPTRRDTWGRVKTQYR